MEQWEPHLSPQLLGDQLSKETQGELTALGSRNVC